MKKILHWILIIGLLSGIFYSFISIFLSNDLPLKYAHIPQETKDFFKRLRDQVVTFNPNPKIGDWVNNKAGEDYLKGYESLEDDNFIVFYTPNTKAENKAKDILIHANAAIRPLENMMGKYYYPKDVNGRKLQLFVTNTGNEYSAIVYDLSGIKPSSSSTAVTCIEYSSMGVLTKGIVFSNDTWEYGEKQERVTVWHEMNHYVLFSSLDLSNKDLPLTWFIEGVAEYFANAESRKSEINRGKAKSIVLSAELPNYYDNYWVGYSVMLCADNNYGSSKTSEFIQTNYKSSLDQSTQKTFGLSLRQLDEVWTRYLEQNY